MKDWGRCMARLWAKSITFHPSPETERHTNLKNLISRQILLNEAPDMGINDFALLLFSTAIIQINLLIIDFKIFKRYVE